MSTTELHPMTVEDANACDASLPSISGMSAEHSSRSAAHRQFAKQLTEVQNAEKLKAAYQKGVFEIYCDNCIKYNVPPIRRLEECLELRTTDCDVSVSEKCGFAIYENCLTNFPIHRSIMCRAASTFNWCAKLYSGHR